MLKFYFNGAPNPNKVALLQHATAPNLRFRRRFRSMIDNSSSKQRASSSARPKEGYEKTKAPDR
jgi:hypothetical protein